MNKTANNALQQTFEQNISNTKIQTNIKPQNALQYSERKRFETYNFQSVQDMESKIRPPSDVENKSIEDRDEENNKTVTKGTWLKTEDDKLMQIVQDLGGMANNWTLISQKMVPFHRTPKQCRERYHQNLKPNLNKDPISAEEGEQIDFMVLKYGKKWAFIARSLNNGRSDNIVKNWWNLKEGKKKRLLAKIQKNKIFENSEAKMIPERLKQQNFQQINEHNGNSFEAHNPKTSDVITKAYKPHEKDKSEPVFTKTLSNFKTNDFHNHAFHESDDFNKIQRPSLASVPSFGSHHQLQMMQGLQSSNPLGSLDFSDYKLPNLVFKSGMSFLNNNIGNLNNNVNSNGDANSPNEVSLQTAPQIGNHAQSSSFLHNLPALPSIPQLFQNNQPVLPRRSSSLDAAWQNHSNIAPYLRKKDDVLDETSPGTRENSTLPIATPNMVLPVSRRTSQFFYQQQQQLQQNQDFPLGSVPIADGNPLNGFQNHIMLKRSEGETASSVNDWNQSQAHQKQQQQQHFHWQLQQQQQMYLQQQNQQILHDPNVFKSNYSMTQVPGLTYQSNSETIKTRPISENPSFVEKKSVISRNNNKYDVSLPQLLPLSAPADIRRRSTLANLLNSDTD
ncbi:hypothetical protein QEN19_003231 [Hanseniaspora menglaensis]